MRGKSRNYTLYHIFSSLKYFLDLVSPERGEGRRKKTKVELEGDHYQASDLPWMNNGTERRGRAVYSGLLMCCHYQATLALLTSAYWIDVICMSKWNYSRWDLLCVRCWISQEIPSVSLNDPIWNVARADTHRVSKIIPSLHYISVQK